MSFSHSNATIDIKKHTSPDKIIEERAKNINQAFIRHRRPRCCCKLLSVDGEDFDFFPASFLFYVIYMVFLCILICIIDILNYYDHNESIIDLLFGYSLESYHSNSIFNLHTIPMSSNVSTDRFNAFIIAIFDHILIFSIMILSIWESLFSFYRYYTTFSTTQNLQRTTSKQIIFRFCLIYGIPFSILFGIQMHFYYWLFPFIILFNTSFNFYCTWKFASMLIKKYEVFIDMGSSNANNFNLKVLYSVYYMKNVSLICCVLQSIYLTVFVVTYNVNIIYYLPILWGISCVVNAMNFVRNRHFIKRQRFKLSVWCKKRCCCNNKINKRKQRHNNITDSVPGKTPKTDGGIKIVYKHSTDVNTENNKGNTDRDEHIKPNPIDIKGSVDDEETEYKPPTITPKRKPKALELLGIIDSPTSAKSPKSSKTPNSAYSPRSPQSPESQTNQMTFGRYIKNKNMMNYKNYTENETKIAGNNNKNKLSPSPVTPTPKSSKANSPINPYANMVKKSDNKPVQNKIANLKKKLSKSKSQKIVIGKQTKEQKPITPHTPLTEDVDDNAGFVFEIDHNEEDDMKIEHEANDSFEISLDFGVDGRKRNTNLNDLMPTRTKLVLSHTKSNSVPIGNIIDFNDLQNIDDDDKNQEMDDVMESFNILAKYGFCSRKTIKSVNELKKYHQYNLKKRKTIQNLLIPPDFIQNIKSKQ